MNTVYSNNSICDGLRTASFGKIDETCWDKLYDHAPCIFDHMGLLFLLSTTVNNAFFGIQYSRVLYELCKYTADSDGKV